MHAHACIHPARLILAGAVSVAAPASAQSDFASRVVDYAPAHGQFVNDPDFNEDGYTENWLHLMVVSMGFVVR